ncbi:hypothetical protein VN97_g3962 [Penicillium thymicola]|uniref:Uncharacterized protein n=1 Tax=Penicillium thymicola TaxID=293382 RepID=A0AAI9TM19_PENTH|nr:hypothetical protein VN97_g3962 [Penicillium thymicola]
MGILKTFARDASAGDKDFIVMVVCWMVEVGRARSARLVILLPLQLRRIYASMSFGNDNYFYYEMVGFQYIQDRNFYVR